MIAPADDAEGQEEAPADAGPQGLPSLAPGTGTPPPPPQQQPGAPDAADAAAQRAREDREDGAEGADARAAEVPQQPVDASGHMTGQPSADAQAVQARGGQQQQQPRAAGAQQQAPQQQDAGAESNPYRSLGGALERWRAQLNVVADAQQLPQQDEDEGAAGEQGGPEDDVPMDEGAGAGGEYEFLAQGEARQAGDTQALAAATEQQAAEQAAMHNAYDVEGEEEGYASPMEEGEAAGDEEGPAGDQEKGASTAVSGRWAAAGGEQQQDEEAGQEQTGKGGREHDTEEPAAEEGVGADKAWRGGLAAARLEHEDGDAGDGQEEMEEVAGEEARAELSAGQLEELRAQLDERLRIAGDVADGSDESYGRDQWLRCEALTAGLAGELAEQLRLILEPTQASKLTGDYRSGKRINMKKVIAYIASHFRKDKIWMRRTRPDKRRYQVLLAIDDSKSMVLNGCAPFALEALTLICKAMSRLEVGELGVLSFGGGEGVRPLHPLERPFCDTDGVRVVSQLQFDQDNTIADRPMAQLLASLQHVLSHAALRAGTGGAHGSVHQLVIILADGRFHEKEGLRSAVRQLQSGLGVMLAFVVLDSPTNSLLDMQSVSFGASGKPEFSKYLDSFPFPFYILLRDISQLPQTLAGLMRQWFEWQSHQAAGPH